MLRTPTNEFDFGDEATVFAELKRVGKSFPNLDINTDFGRYLGKSTGDGKYLVGIKNLACRITSIVRYDSLEALKVEWMLD